MTIDEAIKELRDASDSEVRYGDIFRHYDKVMKRVEAFEIAIKALEQIELNPSYNGVKTELESCEDCISREQALKVIEKEKQGWEGSERYAIDECHTRITELPSVTPTRPKGKWKRMSPAGIYECTNCNQVIMTSDIDCYKFCHGCGVRMEGEE